MSKISIIIPVYNTEKYLKECVDSVLSQTFIDFECILVDDGSTDNSGNICDEYVQKYEKIKIIHKINGGVSSARNAGLDIACGEWIAFIDSDDWVDEKYLEFLYANAIKNDADVSICGINIFKNGKISRRDKHICDVTLTSKEAIFLMYNRKSSFGGFSFNKLLKKQLVERGNFRYDEDIKYLEDMQFFYNIFKLSNKIYYSSHPHYFYRQIETTVTNQVGFTPAVDTAIIVFERLYEEEQDFEIQQNIFFNKIHFICYVCIRCIANNHKDDKFRANMYILKKYIFGGGAIPITLRCKIFVLIYLPFVIRLYSNITNSYKGKLK